MGYQPPNLDAAGQQLGQTLGGFAAGFGNPQQVVNGDGTNGPITWAQRFAAGGQGALVGAKDYTADAQKAKALRSVVQAYAQDEPDPDKQKQIVAASHSMGLADLEGFVQQHAARMADQKTQADIQEQQARASYLKSYGDQREQQKADDATAGQFLQNYLTAPKTTDEDTGDDVDMSPQERLQWAAKKTPNMTGRILPQVIGSLAQWQKLNDPDGTAKKAPTPTFTDIPGTESEIVGYGNESFVVPKTQGNAIYSPDGKLFWNGKGWSELKEQGFPEGSTVKAVNGVNVVVDPKGRILKTVGAQTAAGALSDALGGTGTGAAGGGTGNAPAGAGEVQRITSDGRKAIFDAKTKAFLRYAN